MGRGEVGNEVPLPTGSSRLPRSNQAAPLYRRLREELELLALDADLEDRRPLPPEPELMRRFGVSRGTVRRAVDDLVRAGLLRPEPGRGTFVNETERVRRVIWGRLSKVARPDSRFDLDLAQFIPDFEGRDSCDRAILRLGAYRRARTIFVTPDNSVERLRLLALRAGKRLVVPTFGVTRGFVVLDGASMAPEDHELASTLDGMERKGLVVEAHRLGEVGPVDLLVSGAVAATRAGLHVGGGRGMLDLEWGLLRHLSLVSEDTPVVLTVHDCQVIDAALPQGPTDCTADFLVTPTGVTRCSPRLPRPQGILWELVTPELLDAHPFLRLLD